MNVTVIGSGAWGTTLAGLLSIAGADVTLAVRRPTVYSSLLELRRHPVSIPGYRLPHEVKLTSCVDTNLESGPDLVLVVVPSASVEAVGKLLKTARYGGPIVTATKGLHPELLLTPSQQLHAVLGPDAGIAALSGPNLASEIAAGLPAAAVVASTDEALARAVQEALMSKQFRMYTSTDIVGVEIAGALKNIIAIGAGIADGLDAGQNAKAAYLTRGIAEMVRLGVACGANPMTFAGLAGIGDLIATASSTRSRNNTVGRELATGKSLDAILESLREVAEGVPTTRAALALGKEKNVELPLTTQIARVMFDGISPTVAIAELMAREATGELDVII